MWRSESNFQDSVFFFDHVGPGVALDYQAWQQVPLDTETLISLPTCEFLVYCVVTCDWTAPFNSKPQFPCLFNRDLELLFWRDFVVIN